MAFYFADQLKGTEDSGFDIASSLREMIATLDASKERPFRNAEAKNGPWPVNCGEEPGRR